MGRRIGGDPMEVFAPGVHEPGLPVIVPSSLETSASCRDHQKNILDDSKLSASLDLESS